MTTELDTLRSILANEKDAKGANEARLIDYRDDFNMDPSGDTKAQITRTERKIVNNDLRIKALEYAVNVVASAEDAPEESGYLLTAADFGTGINGDLLYIGPFTEAQEFIKANDNTTTCNRNINTGLWRVELADGNSFGVADTPEMAWRYAMAAEFGPIDDEFQPFRLK